MLMLRYNFSSQDVIGVYVVYGISQEYFNLRIKCPEMGYKDVILQDEIISLIDGIYRVALEKLIKIQ